MKLHKPALLPKLGCPLTMVSGNFSNVMVIHGLEEKGLHVSYLIFNFVLDQC